MTSFYIFLAIYIRIRRMAILLFQENVASWLPPPPLPSPPLPSHQRTYLRCLSACVDVVSMTFPFPPHPPRMFVSVGLETPTRGVSWLWQVVRLDDGGVTTLGEVRAGNPAVLGAPLALVVVRSGNG